MRDVVKTNVKRDENRKRKRRRKRHTTLYFFLVVLLVMGIGILLSVTLFFNVKTINVTGDVDYTNEDIIKMSGIKIGDNLIRLDTQRASDGIMLSMIYIESATIDKQYPGNIEIKVKKCVPTAVLECESGYLVISESGKILEKKSDAADDLFMIKGYKTLFEKPGEYISAEDSHVTEIVSEILKESSKYKEHKITSVDVSDKFDIKLIYENRITFKIGNSNDIAYKLNLAGTVLDKIGKNKKGVMTMAGSNQISFRGDGSAAAPDSDDKKEEATKPTEDSGSEETEAADEASESEYNNDEYSDEDYYEDENYQENYGYDESYDETYDETYEDYGNDEEYDYYE